MDHMRISGTEPSSVILSQTKLFKKLKSDTQKSIVFSRIPYLVHALAKSFCMLHVASSDKRSRYRAKWKI